MTIGNMLLVVMMALASAAGFSRADDALDKAEKDLSAASDKIKSVTFTLTTANDVTFEGGSSKTDTTGTFEVLRKDGKTLFRGELKNTGVTKFGDQEMKQDGTVLTVSDGNVVYMLTESEGQKQAMKNKADPSQNFIDFKSQFEELRKEYEMKLLPDEKVDGKDATVIEATPKHAAEADVSKVMLYYSKEAGLTVKSVAFSKEGNPISTTTLANLKLNPEIAADRFVFTAPEGVVVQDMSLETPPPAQP